MRKVKTFQYVSGFDASRKIKKPLGEGFFHQWIVVEKEVKAVVEDLEGHVELLNHDLVVFCSDL